MSQLAVIPPPAPTTPLPNQAAKGELRLTPGGLMAFDGRSWLPADLLASILDDPANFDRISAAAVLTNVLQISSEDAAEVLPAQLNSYVYNASGVDSQRQPQITLNPAILNEGDQSILASSLMLLGTSPDGVGDPHAYLWAKQAGLIDIGIVTDANNSIETGIGILAGTIYMTARTPGAASSGMIMIGPGGSTFSGDESHNGTTSFSGPVQFIAPLANNQSALWFTQHVANGSYASVTWSWGWTTPAIPVVIAAIDCGQNAVSQSHGYVTTTGFRTYSSNWSTANTGGTTVGINFQAVCSS